MRSALSVLIECEPDLDLHGVAASAEEALEAGTWAECDLLLTDVSLPGLDGVSLMERVLTERPDLPVVVISASAGPSTVRRARDAGARAYLSKASLGDALAPTLREVLRESGPGSPTLLEGAG